MKGPYGFEPNEDCQTCKLRTNGFFCQLPAAALKDLDAIKFSSAYPAGAVLFVEKQPARGIYVLCEGEVKVSVSSSEGKTLILRIARPGEVLGLMSALVNAPHEVTAETIRPCQVAFIRRDAFLRFLAAHPEAYALATRQVSTQYQTACEQLRTVALCSSVQERVAKLLLELSAQGRETTHGTRFKVPLTHEEIAQFIGTTRESVTRALTEFKHQDLIMIQGSTMTVQNRQALEHLVAA